MESGFLADNGHFAGKLGWLTPSRLRGNSSSLLDSLRICNNCSVHTVCDNSLDIQVYKGQC